VRNESGYLRGLIRRCEDGTEGKSTEEIIGFFREPEVQIAQGELSRQAPPIGNAASLAAGSTQVA
jgi:hypothetical protein